MQMMQIANRNVRRRTTAGTRKGRKRREKNSLLVRLGMKKVKSAASYLEGAESAGVTTARLLLLMGARASP